MKTQQLVRLAALALMLAACTAPLPAPPPAPPRLQLPANQQPQLPLEQKTEANKTQGQFLTMTPVPLNAEALLRQKAEQQIYDAGYQPPNALLDGKVDRYTAMKQLYDAGYRPPNTLLDVNR